jgi:hypothetical protein
VAEYFANYKKKFRRNFRNSGPEFRLLVIDPEIIFYDLSFSFKGLTVEKRSKSNEIEQMDWKSKRLG